MRLCRVHIMRFVPPRRHCVLAALLETAPNPKCVAGAIDRAEQWLLEHLSELRRASGNAIYNIWGHAYSIQALVRLHEYHKENAQRQSRLIE